MKKHGFWRSEIRGSSGGSPSGDTVMSLNTGVKKPMLGRYEVEMELGKGATGIDQRYEAGDRMAEALRLCLPGLTRGEACCSGRGTGGLDRQPMRK
jgi:hypothetical protein